MNITITASTILLAIVLSAPHLAIAGTACEGSITSVFVESDGDLLIYLEGQDVSMRPGKLCNVNGEYDISGVVNESSISSKTCTEYHALAITALITARPVTVYLDSYSICNSTWHELSLEDKGFYNLRIK